MLLDGIPFDDHETILNYDARLIHYIHRYTCLLYTSLEEEDHMLDEVLIVSGRIQNVKSVQLGMETVSYTHLPVEAVRIRKSVGCEHTLEKDISKRSSVIIELYHAAVEMCIRDRITRRQPASCRFPAILFPS